MGKWQYYWSYLPRKWKYLDLEEKKQKKNEYEKNKKK